LTDLPTLRVLRDGSNESFFSENMLSQMAKLFLASCGTQPRYHVHNSSPLALSGTSESVSNSTISTDKCTRFNYNERNGRYNKSESVSEPPTPTQAVSVVSFHLSFPLTNPHFTWHMLSSIVYLALLTHNV